MKKVWLITAFVLGVGLISCTRDHPAPEGDTLEILFRPVLRPNTKLEHSDDKTFPSEQPFKLWAFDSKGEEILSGVNAYPVGEGLWKVAEDFLWKRSAEELAFYAASPAERLSFDAQNGFCVKDYSLAEDLDLLYASATVNLEKGSAVMEVPLSFEHALASLRITLTSNLPSTTKVRVKSLTLRGIADEADFCSMPYAFWQANSYSSSLLFWEGELLLWEGENELSPAQYLIPQGTTVNWALTCDVESGGSVLKDQVLKGDYPLILKSGKCTVYRISIYGDLSIKIERDGI